jgi:diguanylate cyclase (GGDEF)-like protein/PAS domain S-box-containing protein
MIDQRFRTIFDSVNDGILVVDLATYAFIDANPRLCELFGYSRAEMLALDIDRLSADLEPATLATRAGFRERARAGEAFIFEWACKKKNGDRFWCEVAVRRATFDEHEVFLLTAQDITRRKSAQAGLAYRDTILHAVTQSVAQLVLEPSLPLAMPRVLQTVGEALSIDRILVLEGSRTTGAFNNSVSFTWERPGHKASVDFERELEPAESLALAAWFAPLLAGTPVTSYADSATGFVADVLRQMGAMSILLVPIEVSGTYWGHLGAEDHEIIRHWTAAEIDGLGIFARVIGSVMARRKVQTALESSEAHFRAVSDTVLDAIVMIDINGRIASWNRAAERIFGYSAAEATGKMIHEWLTPERFRAAATHGMAGFVKTGQGAMLGKTVELAAVRKDGVEIAIELSINAMTVETERYAVGVARDITERKRTSAMIDRFASHDTLTGLPNRRLFIQTLEEAIAQAKRSDQGFAVLYLDLDHFKDVNDTLGHPIGDRLLQQVAARMLGSTREIDTIARFGGDEFAAIGRDIREPGNAATLADKLVEELEKPFLIDDNEIRTGASIGIAMYGPCSCDAEALLAHADVALYRAKADGRGTYRFYTEAMDAEVRARVAIEKELSDGIAAGQFFLLYQPQVDIRSERIVGLEALVRWQHPKRGVLQPAAFIAAAERSGAIVQLGRFVLRDACRRLKSWQEAGIAPPLVAVNVSGVQFKSALQLGDDISAVLTETGVQPQMLELELTESVLMTASLEHEEALLRVRRLGVRISIDDFGTGYSSLDYLRRYRVDRIKIPESFITDLHAVSSNASIVRATLGLARELNIEVIVEGVETAAQLALLENWGAHIVQGFYFSKPLAVPDIAALLHTGRIAPVSGEVTHA